jgi:hypothetical protein
MTMYGRSLSWRLSIISAMLRDTKVSPETVLFCYRYLLKITGPHKNSDGDAVRKRVRRTVPGSKDVPNTFISKTQKYHTSIVQEATSNVCIGYRHGVVAMSIWCRHIMEPYGGSSSQGTNLCLRLRTSKTREVQKRPVVSSKIPC